eukprot:41636_1
MVEMKKLKWLVNILISKKRWNLIKKKIECYNNVNNKINNNHNTLQDDLRRLKDIYAHLDRKCMEKEDEISKLKQFDTNENICNLQKEILENDKMIEISEKRGYKYDEWINNEKEKTFELENDILLKEKELNNLMGNI